MCHLIHSRLLRITAGASVSGSVFSDLWPHTTNANKNEFDVLCIVPLPQSPKGFREARIGSNIVVFQLIVLNVCLKTFVQFGQNVTT